ncbi:MAG: lamin tail domain-containing protein [Bacteroidota bacterium]|nr:lamin tail domain-containing protein [Bacteroidota bacterium]
MKKMYLLSKFFTLMLVLGVGSLSAQNIWINELHYDNAGSDVGEFVEIVLENPGSYSLADFTVTLYNGNNGELYESETLDNFTAGNTSGNFTFYTWYHSGIQNGAPDGLCIDYQGAVISGQFLSYEGTLTATDGPANGMTSVDMGVSESSSTPIGESLQLSGNGTQYDAFSWEPPASETPGQMNNNQSFSGPAPEPTEYPTNFVADATGLSIELTWTDSDGAQLPDAYLIKVSEQNNITPPVDGTAEADDTDLSDGMGALNVGYDVEMATFFRLLSETEYFFEIYPYTNAGTNIDYKTDGSAPATQATTDFAINTNDFEDGDFQTWTTYSVASDKDWAVLDYGGAHNTTYFAEMNGYQENENSNDWLISPAINLDDYSDELVVFYTKWKYGSVDDELEFFYSTDYTGGDPTAASWNELDFEKADDDDTWESSDYIDISGISGENVTFAFQYLSSGNPRRWDVDEIEITGTVTPLGVINVTSPEAGDQWQQGTAHDIIWSASNTFQYVDIELTLNASSGNPSWEYLATDVPADQGYWTWNIAPDQTTSYDCKIRISDHADSDASGESGLFSIIEPVVLPDLVISEIMYNPPEEGNDSIEFIEIYNNDMDTINLNAFSFRDGIVFTFPNMDINPGEYILIALDAGVMQNTFGVTAMQWSSGNLNNSGEALVLINNMGFVVDSVNYDDNAPWPTEPDGNGPSLRFCDFTLDNALGENWSASVHLAAVNADNDSIFATPGYGCVLEPMADFEGSPTAIATGDTVYYTDLSTNGPTAWSWTFEGGEPETYEGQNPPAIVYPVAGEFDVTLSVSNEAGESVEIKEDYIFVTEGPLANFTASDTIVDIGAFVDFTDLSTGDPETWQWSFEGGLPDTSSLQNPTAIHYPTMGLYDVSLTVTNMFGMHTLVKEDYMQVGPVGMAEVSVNEVKIYPNPARNYLNVLCDPLQNNTIRVFNSLGALEMEMEISDFNTRIDGFNATGIYIIQVVASDGAKQSHRILIQ